MRSYLNSELKELTNYERNYTKLKNYYEDSKQTQVFLGHTLYNNDNIPKGYVCGIESGKTFCLEGAEDLSKYDSNEKMVLDLFSKYVEYDDTTQRGCINDDSILECYGDVVTTMYKDSGYVNIGCDDYYCTVYDNGEMRCE